MKTLTISLIFWIPLTLVFSHSISFAEDPYTTHQYTRFSQVNKACEPVLSVASNLEFDANKADRIRAEMFFFKGDWEEESGDSPLLPFDGSDAPQNSSRLPDPLQLVTFHLMHVDPSPITGRAVSVTGALAIGISRSGTSSDGLPLMIDFLISPGSSDLMILFEGVYTEYEENGGGRALCLLGNSNLPSRKPNSIDPWEWAKYSNSSNFQPQLVQDDQILLILRYPKMFTLTSRGIRGDLRSLHDKSNPKYFDDIHLNSQLGASSKYQFASDKLMSKACSRFPYQDDILDRKFDVYKGDGFCNLLHQLFSEDFLKLVPNWNCNFTDQCCRKLGIFEMAQETEEFDGVFANFGLIMQDIRCEQRNNSNNTSYAVVAAVFRVFRRSENLYSTAQRSGLNRLTLSAEGIWNSTTGQLCMVGCLGLAEHGCQSRISLRVSNSFSITQRSLIHGRISSMNMTNSSYYPLSFEWRMSPLDLSNKLSNFPSTTYQYSKLKLASIFKEKSEPFDYGAIIKKSLYSYPKEKEGSDELGKLSNLADELTLYIPAFPDPLPKDLVVKQYLRFEILSLGSLFGRIWPHQSASISKGSDEPLDKTIITKEHVILNVSGELTVSGEPYNNVSVLYVEGLYNPVTGKMYLIGCRDVRASWKNLFDKVDLEDGWDCLIEVKLEYPPTNEIWLMNPSAKVFITSKRSDNDPIYFMPMTLQTLPIFYQKQREDILSRRSVEGILRILALSVAIACIFCQLVYVRHNINAVPYISLVMLGVQALGYCISLTTGAEALFARNASDSYGEQPYDFYKNQWFQVVDYIAKFLVMVAFLLTLRLCQKVWRSRIKLFVHSPLEPSQFPSDIKVLLISFPIHFIGFVLVLVVHSINESNRSISSETYTKGNSHRLHDWGVQIEVYIGLVQDFFLLPQIIGNYFWRINCKPLRKVYYVGTTAIRLLPYVYHCTSAPGFNPYFSQEFQFVNPSKGFYSKYGDVAIPVTATLFALIVLIQQRRSSDSEKIRQGLQYGEKKLLPLRYCERPPSMSVETKLSSEVNGNLAENSSKNDGN